MSCLNINNAAGMDQIPAKFLREAADVLAYPLFINLSVKYLYFQMNVKLLSQNHCLKKALKPIPKTAGAISLLHVVSKMIEKSIHYQLQDLKKVTYSTNTSQVLEQVSLLIGVWHN